MKRIHLIASLLFLVVISACSKEANESKTERGYLDSAYFSKTYRISMDSLQAQKALEESDLKVLQRFMRDFRDSIYGHPTYSELLANAKTLLEKEKTGLSMTVTEMSVRKVQKMDEIRFVLSFENTLGLDLSRFSGDIIWKGENGEKVCTSPAFTIMGPLKANEKIEGMRLEYAFDKPTGNQLNDPRQSAFRDTLLLMEKIGKTNDLSKFEFRLADVVLSNGLSLKQYYCRSPKDQEVLPEAENEKGKVIQMVDWAKKNELWIQKLQRTDAEYKLSIMPILTDKTEFGHGKFFVFDRCEKVKAFFNIQKQIPGSHIRTMMPRMAGRAMVLNERVEFWNWPMEIRIFARK